MRGKERQNIPFYGKFFLSSRKNRLYDDYYVRWEGGLGNLEKAMTMRGKSRVIGTRCGGNLLSGEKKFVVFRVRARKPLEKSLVTLLTILPCNINELLPVMAKVRRRKFIRKSSSDFFALCVYLISLYIKRFFF